MNYDKALQQRVLELEKLPNALDVLFDKFDCHRVSIQRSQCLEDGSEQWQVFTNLNPDLCQPAKSIPEAINNAAERISSAEAFKTKDVFVPECVRCLTLDAGKAYHHTSIGWLCALCWRVANSTQGIQ